MDRQTIGFLAITAVSSGMLRDVVAKSPPTVVHNVASQSSRSTGGKPGFYLLPSAHIRYKAPSTRPLYPVICHSARTYGFRQSLYLPWTGSISC